MDVLVHTEAKPTEPGLFFSTDYMREAAKIPLLAFFCKTNNAERKRRLKGGNEVSEANEITHSPLGEPDIVTAFHLLTHLIIPQSKCTRR